jgi:DNA primase
MAIYTKESLEKLKRSIDLYEVISSHVNLQRAGSSYKACCPFHEEKTPSFVIQRGDSHYHCFGCGAHGDAIAFLMQHLQMTFTQAIEYLSDRFQIALEKTETIDTKSVNRSELRNALEKAAHFYHFFLLHAKEGREALDYLFRRGIDLAFIRQFQVGLAPSVPKLFRETMHAFGFSDELLQDAGLVSSSESGRKKDFFIDRITFPIRDAPGFVIGFSARKYRETSFGGKYINTPETALFKKSHVLFGLSYSRKRIAKEKKAIIVEGQIDALRLIKEGFTITVASQGTAFGEDHVKELLHLGVKEVFLAFDGDEAGLEAAVKVGDLFQKKGVEVFVIVLKEGEDPDLLLQTQGPEVFAAQLEKASDYLTFLFNRMSAKIDIGSPSAKGDLVETIAARVRNWEHALMVYESLRKLARLASIPEEVIGIGVEAASKRRMLKRGHLSRVDINPDYILEADLLRWLLVMGESNNDLTEIAKANLNLSHFRSENCKEIFSLYLDLAEKNEPRDILSITLRLPDEQRPFLDELLSKKINIDRARQCFVETTKKLLIRSWMEERAAIKSKIDAPNLSEGEKFDLLREFDALNKKEPHVLLS